MAMGPSEEIDFLKATQQGGGVLTEPQHAQLEALAEAESARSAHGAHVSIPIRVSPSQEATSSDSTHIRAPPPSPASFPHSLSSRSPTESEDSAELERKKRSIAAALNASTAEALTQIRIKEEAQHFAAEVLIHFIHSYC